MAISTGWRFLAVVLVLLLLAEVSGAAQKQLAGTADEPIRVAAVFSLTGIAARHNKPLVEMIQVAVERVNSDGGVLGRKIELLVLDNKSTPIGSLEAAQKAVAARVTAVIGAHWSSHSLAMAPLLQDAGIPMISPASTNPDVTRGRSYVFRVCFLDSMQGEAMARFAREELQLRSVAILRNIDERYSIDLASFFQKSFLARGGSVVLNAGYRGDSTDFAETIAELLKLQPQAIYIPGYTRDTALFMKQARQKGVTAVFLGGDGWDLLGALIGEVIEGSYQTVLWHPDVPYSESNVVRNLYRETNGHEIQNLTTPLGYDAVMLLVDALRRAGSVDRVKLREALAATRDFPGSTGPITFDENGDPLNKEIIIVKFVGGKTDYITAIRP